MEAIENSEQFRSPVVHDKDVPSLRPKEIVRLGIQVHDSASVERLDAKDLMHRSSNARYWKEETHKLGGKEQRRVPRVGKREKVDVQKGLVPTILNVQRL